MIITGPVESLPPARGYVLAVCVFLQSGIPVCAGYCCAGGMVCGSLEFYAGKCVGIRPATKFSFYDYCLGYI